MVFILFFLLVVFMSTFPSHSCTPCFLSLPMLLLWSTPSASSILGLFSLFSWFRIRSCLPSLFQLSFVRSFSSSPLFCSSFASHLHATIISISGSSFSLLLFMSYALTYLHITIMLFWFSCSFVCHLFYFPWVHNVIHFQCTLHASQRLLSPLVMLCPVSPFLYLIFTSRVLSILFASTIICSCSFSEDALGYGIVCSLFPRVINRQQPQQQPC